MRTGMTYLDMGENHGIVARDMPGGWHEKPRSSGAIGAFRLRSRQIRAALDETWASLIPCCPAFAAIRFGGKNA
jgi:hypothetical protein